LKGFKDEETPRYHLGSGALFPLTRGTSRLFFRAVLRTSSHRALPGFHRPPGLWQAREMLLLPGHDLCDINVTTETSP